MKRRKPSKQERQSRMTLTLTLSGCVFVVTLVTLLIIGAALLIVDRTGQLGKWMEHSSILFLLPDHSPPSVWWAVP